MPPNKGVRARRYALACALAAVTDDGGQRTRALEALEEFDRALHEEGTDPPADRIELEAGRILETIDPARAFQRYVAALDGAAAEEAAQRARELLDASSEPAAMIESLAPQTIDRVSELARSTPIPKSGSLAAALEKVTPWSLGPQPGQLILLAALLLRHRGADDEALEMLQRAYGEAGPRAREVAWQLAETYLDLGRVKEAVALVEREDATARNSALQLVRAEAHLMASEFEEAFRITEQFLTDDAAPPAVAAIRALSLLALDREDEAAEALDAASTVTAEIHGARAIVGLQRREYEAARDAAWSLLRAHPTNPLRLLLNAQTVVEALGAASQSQASDDAASADVGRVPLGGELDAVRRLLEDVPKSDPRSRWWHIQAAIRKDDDRYRYFLCERQFARETAIDVDEADDLYDGDTTLLQKAALEELKAKSFSHPRDDALAAQADDDASRIFGDLGDPERAWSHARRAYERAPTADRAAEYADRALAASYDDADPSESRERLDHARAVIEERWLADVDDDGLGRLVNLLAWLRSRIGEISIEDSVERAAAVLPWLLAGVAALPDDAVLRAVLASSLSELERTAGSVTFAQDAFEADRETLYVVDTALVAAANYYGELDRVRPLLSRHATQNEDESWRNAVELELCLVGGDREGVERRHGRPIIDAPWARRTHAVASALLHGIPHATQELAGALHDCLEVTPPRRDEAAVLAALLRRRDVAQSLDADARTYPELTELGPGYRRLVEQFAFDSEMGPQEFVEQALEFCTCPTDVHRLVNATLPLLAAARSGSAGPVPAIAVERQAVDQRLRDFADPWTRCLDELEAYGRGLSVLARLADVHSGLASVAEAEREAARSWPEELPTAMRDRLPHLVLQRAVADLPRRLRDARLARGAEVGRDDVRLALAGRVDMPMPHRLATAVLALPADRAAAEEHFAGADDEDVAAAADEIVEVETIDDYGKLDAVVESVLEDSTPAPVLRDVAAAARDRLGFRLDRLLGLVPDTSALEIAIVTPIVVEVGADLVPFVDPSQDGGVFIEELVPAMQRRILDGTGVSVPGLRMRRDPALARNEYRVQIDEVRVLLESIPVAETFAVFRASDARDSRDELTAVHPLTGESGIWAVRASSEDVDADGHLTTAQYLLHRIEQVIRAHLARFLGPQEVAALVDTWSLDDGDALIASTLPDSKALLRLTWVLQALVEDAVPIADWRTILRAIEDAGGVEASSPSLYRSVRTALRAQLPGAQTWRKAVPVPDEHQDALLALASNGSREAPAAEPRHEFLRWLERRIAEEGPALSLVTRAEEVRERVDALARTESRLIATISEDERGPDGG